MTSEIAALIRRIRSNAVFTLEFEGIWFSGMNQNVGILVKRVAANLRAMDIEVDGWDYVDGGILLHVPDARPVPDDSDAVADGGEA